MLCDVMFKLLRRRSQKGVDAMLAELGVAGPPAMATRATCGSWLALRAEVIAMLDLRRQYQVGNISGFGV